jgi:ATP/maltotriose-dependent transcriptional regulator MalT
MNLGSIAAQRGEFAEAAVYNERALELATESGLEELRLITLVNSGQVARDSGDEATACRLWAEALPALQDMEHYAAEIVVESRQSLGCPGPAVTN